MKQNGTVARAAVDRDLLVATLSRSTPKELHEVATLLQKRSSDHAAVLHDSLYIAATQRRARPAPAPVRRTRASRVSGASLKARLRLKGVSGGKKG